MRREEEVARPVLEVPEYSEQELVVTVFTMKKNRASGPDGIPAKILKGIADSHPQLLLCMLNALHALTMS